MSDSQVSRRQFVGGAAALGGGIALPMAGVGMARPQQALDLSVPQDFLTAIVKMRGGTTPTLNMGFVIGGYYGVVDDRATPLFGVLAGTFTQYHPVDDLSYRIKAETRFQTWNFDWILSFGYERYTSSGDLTLGKVSLENPGLVSFNLFSVGLEGRF